MRPASNQLRLLGTLGGGVAAGVLAGLLAERRAVRAPRLRDGAADPPLPPAAADPPLPAAAGDAAVRVRTVTATDGTPLYVEEVGDPGAAVTVVFAHGWTMDLRNWLFQRRDLPGPGVRLVLYDQRGHGRSGRPADLRSCTIEQFARDLHSVLERCAPTGPVVLVGHSMGGMTVMGLADAHPELFGPAGRVVGVALLSTSAGQTARVTLGLPAVVGRLVARGQPGLARGLNRFGDRLDRRRPLGTDLSFALTRRLSFGGPVPARLVELMESMVAACPVAVIGACLDELLRHDKLAALPTLADTPTLVLVGGADVLTPVEHSRTIAAALPDAELVVLPGVGHMAHLERPDVVTGHLRALLARAVAAR